MFKGRMFQNLSKVVIGALLREDEYLAVMTTRDQAFTIIVSSRKRFCSTEHSTSMLLFRPRNKKTNSAQDLHDKDNHETSFGLHMLSQFHTCRGR
jgi:hypothetical protein